VKVNWLIVLFLTWLNKFLYLRQKLWRWVYNKVIATDKLGNFLFMNYGYQDESDGSALFLESGDEPCRYFIQLYNFVVRDIDLQAKAVMEVGCGRGGGGSFILRYKNPRSYIGIDLSEEAINWCKSHFQWVNAHWIQASASFLPVADNSVDVIINVESSHCYPNMKHFLSEVKRTLRLGGYFAFCDLRHVSSVEKLDQDLTSFGLELVKSYKITPYVLNALSHISKTRDEQITSVFPKLFRSAVRDFAAVKATRIYRMLETGQMQYLFYLLKKNNEAGVH
jgi:ubiquinone/menaquinone biosynthesis C-methylase UbiE